jgi:hypothetical protein
VLEFSDFGAILPSVLGGFLASGLGMVLGSLRWPQQDAAPVEP